MKSNINPTNKRYKARLYGTSWAYDPWYISAPNITIAALVLYETRKNEYFKNYQITISPLEPEKGTLIVETEYPWYGKDKVAYSLRLVQPGEK